MERGLDIAKETWLLGMQDGTIIDTRLKKLEHRETKYTLSGCIPALKSQVCLRMRRFYFLEIRQAALCLQKHNHGYLHSSQV